MIRYLFVAPIRHAQVDPLWFVGGVGCVFMLIRLRARARPAQAGHWMDSRPVGGARVHVDRDQRQPRSAAVLPAGGAGAGAGGRDGGGDRPPATARGGAVGRRPAARRRDVARRRRSLSRSSPATSGTTRNTRSAGSIAAPTWRSTARATCDKYSALDNRDLGEFLASHTAPTETVFIFGYSSGAYVYADRRSASRFFWSRPVIVGFNGGDPGYGVNGLRADLELRDSPPTSSSRSATGRTRRTRRRSSSSQPRARRLGCATTITGWTRSSTASKAWERNGPSTPAGASPRPSLGTGR